MAARMLSKASRLVRGDLGCSGSAWSLHTPPTLLVIPVRGKKRLRLQAAKESNKAKPARKVFAKRVEKVRVDPDFLKRVPVDSVWVHEHYPPQKCSLEEALLMHKEASEPAVFDNQDAVVYMKLQTCMKLKKKTKFLASIRGITLLPHYFPFTKPKKIMAFVGTEDQAKKALEMGAVFAGGKELVTQVLHEEIDPEDYDTVLSTINIVQELIPLKKIFSDAFPSKTNSTLGMNIEDMMNLYVNGVEYCSERTTQPELATLTIPIGMMDMPCEQMIENFDHFVKLIESGRTYRPLGPTILQGECICPPSPQVFSVSEQSLGHDEAAQVQEASPAKKAGKAAKGQSQDDDSDDEEDLEEKRRIEFEQIRSHRIPVD